MALYVYANSKGEKFEEFRSMEKRDDPFIDSNGERVSADISGGIDTKYTYKCIINSQGTFRLVVVYVPYGYTFPVGGKVLEQTVTGPPFTL